MVPKLWPGETVVCMATGPSLTPEDVASVHGAARVIVVNDAYRLAPWADCLYAADGKWWRWHHGVPDFAGMKYSVQQQASQDAHKPGVVVLRNAGKRGLSLDPSSLSTGHNSGYQAINLAVHFGARRVLLLGYDMRGGHFFGDHPDNTKPPFALAIPAFSSLVSPLKAIGVDVINCTPNSALKCFPKVPIADAIAAVAA